MDTPLVDKAINELMGTIPPDKRVVLEFIQIYMRPKGKDKKPASLDGKLVERIK